MNKNNESVTGVEWRSHKYELNYAQEISNKYSIPEISSRIIAQQNIDKDKVEYFLNPKLKNLMTDPYLLKDMEKATEIIYQSIINKENICVFADYDVDGATSSAILRRFFKDIGIISSLYIPDRIKEGYGPSIEAFTKIHNNNTNLVITLDCGTTSNEAIAHGKNIGLKIIVVDHHKQGEILPDADAIINPNRNDDTNENYRNLAAAGVTFLLIVSLHKKLLKEKYLKDKINILKYLDIVALGTVCDVVELSGINRAYVKQGLKIIDQTNNQGIKSLIKFSEINQPITTYHLGYIIGPIINAGGRIGTANLGSKLLYSDSQDETQKIAQELIIQNSKRKEIESKAVSEAILLALKQEKLPIIFVAGDWHQGVIGIVASKLKDRFNKPSFVISTQEKEGKGSCRSIKGLDIGSIILEAKTSNILIAGGGHSMAAGFSVSKTNLEILKEFLSNNIDQKLSLINDTNVKYYNADISCDGLNLKLYEDINILSPFGVGNPTPIFKISDLYIIKSVIRGSKHISCILGSSIKYGPNKTIKAIAFNSVDTEIGNILLGTNKNKISIIGTLNLNNYLGNINVEFTIRDVIIN